MVVGKFTPPAQDRDPAAAPSILIVEDEALIASYIREVLEESGFIVAGVASSGAEAIALAASAAPHLALVDIKLAGPMDGIEVARLMRSRFNVMSIFLSSTGDANTIARASTVPPLGFLEKPFRPSQVFNALQRALDGMTRAKEPVTPLK
ncbi:MAG TPA: response regulator [Stellaceae bacterium]|nr:response regulator [Stellaceae bacterium]